MLRDAPEAHDACCKIPIALTDPDFGEQKAQSCEKRVAFSGVNPGDVKKRQDAFGVGMPYPRVIPHSDGSGTVDAVGKGIWQEWIGRSVWCYGAQSYRPFGTAAELSNLGCSKRGFTYPQFRAKSPLSIPLLTKSSPLRTSAMAVKSSRLASVFRTYPCAPVLKAAFTISLLQF
jgi:hypothetical protein